MQLFSRDWDEDSDEGLDEDLNWRRKVIFLLHLRLADFEFTARFESPPAHAHQSEGHGFLWLQLWF
jgi:hypothetical protein